MITLWLEWVVNMILALPNPMKTNREASERSAVKKMKLTTELVNLVFQEEEENAHFLPSSQ